MRWCLLPVLLAGLLGLGATQGLAAPEIVSYSIGHDTSYGWYSDPPNYNRNVCTTVRDPGGAYDATTVEVTPPGGGTPTCQCGWGNDDGTWTYAWKLCQTSPPEAGTYLLRAIGPDGSETSLETGETTPFPVPLEWASPMPEAVFASTRPTLGWLPYTGFSDPAGTEAGTVKGNVFVWTTGPWGALISADCLEPAEITDGSWQYASGVCPYGLGQDNLGLEVLPPGHAYLARVSLQTKGHALPNNGWYNEGTSTNAVQFGVAGSTPTFEYLDILRGARLYPNGRTVYGEWLRVFGSDLRGGDRLQFQVHDPPNVFRKQTGTLLGSWTNDLTAGREWQALDLPSLRSGPYVVGITDRVTNRQVSITYHPSPVMAPAITYPRNGQVIAAGEDLTFRWQPMQHQCSYQVWVEEIPASSTGEIFEWVWYPAPLGSGGLTFPDSRSVWCLGKTGDCVPGDATSVVYGAQNCAEDLQSGHHYRLHVMCNAETEGDPVSPLWPTTYPVSTASESMVDFRVE